VGTDGRRGRKMLSVFKKLKLIEQSLPPWFFSMLFGTIAVLIAIIPWLVSMMTVFDSLLSWLLLPSVVLSAGIVIDVIRLRLRNGRHEAGDAKSEKGISKNGEGESVTGKITKEIIGYAREPQTIYAVMLTGGWGVGKTYYVEEVLKPKLEKEGIKVIRCSCFGVRSVKTLQKKILGAVLPLMSEDSTAGRVSNTISDITSVLHKTVEKVPEIHLDTAVLAPEFLKRFDSLIVIDDFERCSASILSDVIGYLNDLVENQGKKVLIVANEDTLKERLDKGGASKAKGRFTYDELKEKVVWKTYKYVPPFLEQFESALGDIIIDDGADFRERTSAALETRWKSWETGRAVNFRALLKSKSLLHDVCTTDFIREDGKDKHTDEILADVIRYSIRCAENNPPEDPRAKKRSQDGQEDDFIRDALEASMNGRQSDRDRYDALTFIGEFFSDSNRSVGDIEDCLEGYQVSFYPLTRLGMRASEILQSASPLDSSDDENREKLGVLCQAVKENVLGYPKLINLLDRILYFTDMGYTTEENATFDQVKGEALRLATNDPKVALHEIELAIDFYRGETNPHAQTMLRVMNELSDRAREALAKREDDAWAMVLSRDTGDGKEIDAWRREYSSGTHLGSFSGNAVTQFISTTSDFCGKAENSGLYALEALLHEIAEQVPAESPVDFGSCVEEATSGIRKLRDSAERARRANLDFVIEDLEKLAKIYAESGGSTKIVTTIGPPSKDESI